MKTRYFSVVAVAALLCFAALMTVSCTGKKKEAAPKAIILYYSQTTNTRTVAEAIQSLTGADIEEIIPLVPYDGDYQATIERSRKEREEGVIPEVQPLKADLKAYDIVYLGYPIWFGTYAPPVAGLLKVIDLTGKKVVPFCTFGSGGLLSSIKDLKAAEPGAEVVEGYGVRAARIAAVPEEVEFFLKSNCLVEGDVEPLPEFGEEAEATEEVAAIFDKAVGDYPMINAKATAAASRPIPGGTEYRIKAKPQPREGFPAPPGPMGDMTVYVTVKDGHAPEFTQVVR